MRNSLKLGFCLCAIITMMVLSLGRIPMTSIQSHIPALGEDHGYEFSIRIAYRGIFGIVGYADLPMGVIIQENETVHFGGSHSGGFLTSLVTPPYIEEVSTWSNEFGWRELVNGTGRRCGGTFGWDNYSIWGGWSSSHWSPYNKSTHRKLLRWIVISNITVSFINGIRIKFDPDHNINVTGMAILTESGWVYNASASSSFPEDRVNLDVDAHIMTIYINYPTPPLPVFVIPLIIGIVVVASAVSIWIILRRNGREELVFDQVQP